MLELRERIGLDAGYLSRVVSRLERQGLIRKRRSERGRAGAAPLADRRRGPAPATLDRRSAEQVEGLLDPIPVDRQAPSSSRRCARSTGPRPASSGRVEIRAACTRRPRLGRRAPRRLFPAASTAGAPASRRWSRASSPSTPAVADQAGNGGLDRDARRRARRVDPLRRRRRRRRAKLRLLLVEPFARGHGHRRALVDECISFAPPAGYQELVLWTMDVLCPRATDLRAGRLRARREFHHTRFGPELVGQDWRLAL